MNSLARPRLIPLLVVLLSLAAGAASFALSIEVLEGLPHIEDEMAYDWQARVIAQGRLTLETPQPCPKCFLVPFVVDYEGQRFGKYPLGWPALLSFGHLPVFKNLPYARNVINPLLAGASVWLAYLLVKKVLDERTALLASFLTATSPFFLMNSALLLSHPWSLFLTLSFCLGWLDAFTQPNEQLPAGARRWLPALVAALSMGMLALTRPMTALAVAVPFSIHGLVIMLKGTRAERLRLVWFGLGAGTLAMLLFAWQLAVTGDPFLNPYTLWWPYDRVGFGPGIGTQPGGFRPVHAIANTRATLHSGEKDLFGWMSYSYVFIPLGLWAIRRRWKALLVASVLFSLIAAYFTYWMSASLVGPRYYFEGIYGAAMLSASGILWLAGGLYRLAVGSSGGPGNRPDARSSARFVVLPVIWRRPLFSLAALVLFSMVVYNLAFYMPARFQELRGLYGVSKTCYQPFESEAGRRLAPALVAVVVENKWIEYGCMLDMSSPFMDSDFVLIVSTGYQMDTTIAASLPGRRLLYYYPRSGILIEAVRSNEPADW